MKSFPKQRIEQRTKGTGKDLFWLELGTDTGYKLLNLTLPGTSESG